MEKQRDFKVLSGAILKIIALIFMTIDHIGVFLSLGEKTQEIATIFRIIGRLSFPLIIFVLVEGVIHTRNFKKYILRLGILAVAFLIGQLFYYFVIEKDTSMLAATVDLVLTALCVYLLKRKDKLSFLAVLPVGWAVLCLVVRNYEISHVTHLSWLPFFLRTDYSIYGPLLGIGFFYANDLAILFLKSNQGTKDFVGTTYERTAKNLISASFLIIITIALVFLDKNAFRTLYSIPWQIYSLFAFIPILLYSGKRGYNAKWFQYGCYIYYPMHFIILFLIFSLL